MIGEVGEERGRRSFAAVMEVFFGRERAGARRSEGDNRRKKKVIYSKPANRRAVG